MKFDQLGRSGLKDAATDSARGSVVDVPALGRQTRRALMMSLAGVPLAGGLQASAAAEGDTRKRRSAVLVAYFSRTGNTRVVAGLLQRALGAAVFEIRPARAYPDEYLATVEAARQERDRGEERALAAKVSDIANYDTLYLGFPIWGETVPPVVKSFLSAHDLAGKALIPFITHGGYGLGNSEAVIKRLAPDTRLQRGFTMQADQERQTMERVEAWLQDNPARRSPRQT